MNENNNSDLVKFYTESIKILKLKATHNGINHNELNWYFDPVSRQHLDRYIRIYGLARPIVIKSNDFLFLRFTSSVFNSGYHNDMTNNPLKFKELAKSTFGFDIKAFLLNYPVIKDYELELKNIGNYPLLNSLKPLRFEQMVKSVYSTAVYLRNNNLFNSSITLKNPSIYGMSKTLYSDAIKECNLQDIAKPDSHIVDVMNCALGTRYNKNALKKSDHIEIQDIIKRIAVINNVSVYKVDKILWLVCAKSGNDFYLHHTVNFKTQLCNNFK